MPGLSPSRTPTLRDVAKRAGVSVPTVSKVLNGRADVGQETRTRVQDAVAEVGYRRKPSASVDALIAEQLVDLVLPAIGDSWASALIAGVERVAAQHGLDLVVMLVHPDNPEGPGWVDRLIDHRSRGALVAVVQPSPAECRTLERAGIPVVLIDPVGLPNRSTASVGASNWSGGHDAANLFLDNGHTSLAVMGGDAESSNSRERVAGFLAGVRERNAELHVPVVQGGWLMHTGMRAAGHLLGSDPRPTAIFACNDNMALGVYAAAQRAGLRIPDELSVVGFDDLVEARVASPPLTTVRQPVVELGATAMRSLLDLRSGRPTSRRRELPTELVIRGSVGPAPTSPRG